MAEVATSINASASTNSDSGQIIASESSESVLLSPGVKEAMDRIFPKSASQFLQPRALFDENPLVDVPMGPFPNSHATASVACSGSMAHTIPNSLQTTAFPVANELLTSSASIVTSVMTSASSGDPLTSFSVNSVLGNHDKDKDINSDMPEEVPYQPRKKLAKLRISKADLEIINSSDAFGEDSRGRSSANKHSSPSHISSSDCPSKGGTDSEEIIRPFANIGREKKRKHKRKKKREKLNREKSNHVAYQNLGNSEDELNIGSGRRQDREKDMQYRKTVSKIKDNGLEEFNSSTKCKKQKHSLLSVENSEKDGLHFRDSMHKAGRSRTSSQDSRQSSDMPKDLKNGNFSQKAVQENGSVSKDLFDSNCEVISEDFSNISCSSSKENVQNEKRGSSQKLPKTKRDCFSLIKHKNKIKNTFPPCFVVLEKITMLPVYNLSKDNDLFDNVLPLSKRVKILSDLCIKGSIVCKKKKKKKVVKEVRYKKICDQETVSPGQSEEDFESPRGKRSLRKRDKKISYVEPSEDDILGDFSRKRSCFISTDSPPISDSESVSDVKKKRKSDVLDKEGEDVVTVDSSEEEVESSKVVSPPKKKIKRTSQEEGKSKTQLKRKEDENVEYVYLPLNSSRHYTVPDKDGNLLIRNEKKSKMKSPAGDKNKVSVAPQNPHISVLPTSSLQGPSSTTSTSVSVFPSLTPRLATQPIMGSPVLAPIQASALPASATLLPQASQKPQYCMVKMDGKDVLLQLVPSGTSGSGTQAMTLPGGKKIIMPSTLPVVSSSQIIGQAIHQRPAAPNLTQAVTVPMTAASIPQGNTISPPPLQPLYGIPVVSRAVNVGSGSTALSALIKASQIAGLTSNAGFRPLALNSPASVAGNVMPLNVQTVTATAPGSLSSLRPVSTVSPALSAALAPMAAPASTTVVRSVRVPGSVMRAVAPNQPNNIRSVRIFVPGCSATGVPGRFATLGSIAGSSPLTRLSASSELLPQRKNASEQELTLEQKAAKRRKLEKKYPLPPGVVIKTEPLDSPPKAASVQTTATRSLLPQNIQLLSSGARPGPGVQSIRIISPSVAGGLARPVRGSSNVIYRAASIGNQHVLVPTSVGLLSTTKTTTSNTTSSITVLSTTCPSTVTSSASTNAITARESTTVLNSLASTNCTSTAISSVTTTISSSAHISVVATVSSPPFPLSTQPSELNSNICNMTASSTSSSHSSAPILSPAVTAVCTVHPTTTTESLTTTSPSVTTASLCTVTSSSTSNKSLTPPPRNSVPDAPTLENLRISIEGLSKFVQGQEGLGLKGERLDKLKELLRKKQEQYEELKKASSTKTHTSSVVSTLPICTDVADTEKSSSEAGSVEGSELEPFVID